MRSSGALPQEIKLDLPRSSRKVKHLLTKQIPINKKAKGDSKILQNEQKGRSINEIFLRSGLFYSPF